MLWLVLAGSSTPWKFTLMSPSFTFVITLFASSSNASVLSLVPLPPPPLSSPSTRWTASRSSPPTLSPPRWILCGYITPYLLIPQIDLVANQHDGNLVIGMLPDLLQPPLDILKGSPLINIVYHEYPWAVPVITPGNGSKGFLSRSIPNLKFNGLPDIDYFWSIFDSYSGLVLQLEGWLLVTQQNAGFTDSYEWWRRYPSPLWGWIWRGSYMTWWNE